MTGTSADWRSAHARQFILSEDFYQGTRKEIDDTFTQGGTNIHYHQSKFLMKKEDLPLLQVVFNRLKKEYPQLNHVRLNSVGTIIFDTQKNTFWRRLNNDHPEF